jgi:Family of unknown function (DUF5681)
VTIRRKTPLVTEAKQRRIPSEKELANLKPFQPGQSGNPSGRAKDPFRQALLKAVNKALQGDPEGRAMIDGIALQLANKALKGDLVAIGMIADRTDGKPAQSVTLGGDGSGVPIEIAGMTPEEKRRRLAEIMAKARGTH